MDEKTKEKLVERMSNLRSQMRKSQFKEAMRSARSAIETDEQISDLLRRLDEAEKK